MRRRLLHCIPALMVLASTPAQADMLGLAARDDVAGSRPQPEYDPLGLRLGAWTLAPELRINGGYESNVFGLPDGSARGDGFVVVAPSARLQSDWGLHALDLNAAGTFTRYTRFARQNTNEYNAGASGRIDLGSGSISPRISIVRAAERRGTNGTPLIFGEPSLYRDVSAEVEAKQGVGDIALGLVGRYGDVNYSDLTLTDGTRISQKFRDAESWGGEARVRYSPGPALSVFAAGRYDHFHATLDLPTLERTSNRMSLTAGYGIDLGMLRTEISAGYLRQHFTNPLFPDFSGLTYEGSVSYFPTTLLSVTIRARRALENSGVANVGAIVARTGSIKVDYELLRNLVLHATVSGRRERFREVDAAARTRRAELRADYRFNRTVAIGVYGERECRDSSLALAGAVRSFCSALGGVSLSLKM